MSLDDLTPENTIEGGTDGTAIGNKGDSLKISNCDAVHGIEAQHSTDGTLKISTDTIVADYRFYGDTITDLFDFTVTGGGRYEIPNGKTGLKMIVPTAGDKIKAMSKEKHFYQSGRGIKINQSIITGDNGVAGCTREWGLLSEDEEDGVFWRLSGTTLQWVRKSNGVENVTNASAFDIPVTFSGYGNLYQMAFRWLGVDDIFLSHAKQVVHKHNFVDTSYEFSLGRPDLNVYYCIENTSNNDERYLKMGCAEMAQEGGANARRLDQNPVANDLAALSKSQLIGLTSDGHYHSIEASELNELLVQARINNVQLDQLLTAINQTNKLLKINNMHLAIMNGINIEGKDV